MKSCISKGLGMTSKMAKNAKAITENTKYYVKKYGIEHVAFGTITFKENLTDTKEAQRRYNSFATCINRSKKFKILLRIVEFQKRGAVHYHFLIKTTEPIRKDFDFQAFHKAYEDKKNRRKYTRIYANSATNHLRHLWGYMRERAQKHGFGRTEIMPIEYPNNVGSYLGKYVAKDQGKKGRGVRKISYARSEAKPASPYFSWLEGKGAIWRRNLKAWAEARGFKNTDEIAEAFGPRWSYHLYQEIMYDAPRLARHGTENTLLSEQKKRPLYRPDKEELNEYWNSYFQRDEVHKPKCKKRTNFKEIQLHEAWKRKETHKKSMAYLY